jgi:glycosyltransferase involved in cell wall biosynthesis
MEWIVLDDGQELCQDIFLKETETLPNIRYISLQEKVNIGEKRNMLNKLAKGEILVCMDDDDYYCPERVSHVVDQFQKNPTLDVAGSTVLYMYYVKQKEIIKLGPYNEKHATNGTMAWRRSYADTHAYDENLTFAEEKSFLDNYKHPIVQLDPRKVMLVMSHDDNTFNKDGLRLKETQFVKKTNLTLKDFIKNSELIKLFETL